MANDVRARVTAMFRTLLIDQGVAPEVVEELVDLLQDGAKPSADEIVAVLTRTSDTDEKNDQA